MTTQDINRKHPFLVPLALLSAMVVFAVGLYSASDIQTTALVAASSGSGIGSDSDSLLSQARLMFSLSATVVAAPVLYCAINLLSSVGSATRGWIASSLTPSVPSLSA